MDITLSSILFIVQCEIHIVGVLEGYIYSVNHALEVVLHRCFGVSRCVLIGCKDVVLCCDVDLLIGCIGSEGSFTRISGRID